MQIGSWVNFRRPTCVFLPRLLRRMRFRSRGRVGESRADRGGGLHVAAASARTQRRGGLRAAGCDVRSAQAAADAGPSASPVPCSRCVYRRGRSQIVVLHIRFPSVRSVRRTLIPFINRPVIRPARRRGFVDRPIRQIVSRSAVRTRPGRLPAYRRGHSPTSMSRICAPSTTSRTAVRTLWNPYSPAAPGLTASRS